MRPRERDRPLLAAVARAGAPSGAERRRNSRRMRLQPTVSQPPALRGRGHSRGAQRSDPRFVHSPYACTVRQLVPSLAARARLAAVYMHGNLFRRWLAASISRRRGRLRVGYALRRSHHEQFWTPPPVCGEHVVLKAVRTQPNSELRSKLRSENDIDQK